MSYSSIGGGDVYFWKVEKDILIQWGDLKFQLDFEEGLCQKKYLL